MNTGSFFSILIIAFFLIGFPKKEVQEKRLSFPHSYISLMPEGEPSNLKEFLPIHPKIVAWGADPIHADLNDEKMEQKLLAYKNIGIEYLASNVWMLTATDPFMYRNPEYQQAVCKDIEGNPIIPNWLDSDYNGVKPWWGCTNHPLYRELTIKRVLGGIRNGANMLHLDDHMGTAAAASHSGGCFCSYCMEGFSGWLENNYSLPELKQMGIDEIESFDYSKMIRNKGFSTKSDYMQAVAQNKIPLRDEFMNFQLEAAAGLVKELGKIAEKEAGLPVPVGVNSWNLAPTQLATAQYADYFSNEVSHFDEEDFNPPFVYLLGNALGKPVFSTGTGEDWIHIKNHEVPVRVQHWISTAYAFGHFFMYSWNKWGFSEETGTQWYQIPIETFQPVCSFINQHPTLFDGFEALEKVGILYENEVCRGSDKEIKLIVQQLNYAYIPVGIAASGDSWLKHELTSESLNRFDYLILPEKTSLDKNEEQLIEKFAERGTVLKWGQGTDVLNQLPVFSNIIGAEKVWLIPRINRNKKELVIHLLNQDYNNEKEKMNTKLNFEVFISKVLSNDINTSNVVLYSTSAEPTKLQFKREENGIKIQVPKLEQWSIIKFE